MYNCKLYLFIEIYKNIELIVLLIDIKNSMLYKGNYLTMINSSLY